MNKIISILMINFMIFFIGINHISAAPIQSVNGDEINNTKIQISNLLEKTAKIFLEKIKNEYLNFKAEDEIKTGQKNLQGKKIVIDPGHGGSNPGAIAYGYHEADNNLAVSLKLKSLLEKQGAQVLLTRTENVNVAKIGSSLREELQARVALSQDYDADLFVSIHSNANENASIHGAMTFYYDDNSKYLADFIQDRVIQSTSAADKGIAEGNFYVLKNSTVPAVLVEMGFITNKSEAEKLNSNRYRDTIAEGISQGIHDFFKN